MVVAKPRTSGDPREAALDHPSSGQRTKAGREELLPRALLSLGNQHAALGYGEGTNGLHGPFQVFTHPLDHAVSVMTIASHQLDAGKGCLQRLQQLFGLLLSGAIGSQHFDRQYMDLRINQ